MKISVKCPNCYQQVSKENRFCIYCGYDLEGVSSDVPEDKPVSFVPAPVAPDPMPYTGPRFCPKGHDVPDPSLGFCPTCGSPLVDEYSAEDSSAEEASITEEPVVTDERELEKKESIAFTSRKCRCGYVCDDPELNFCPACGIPFDSDDYKPEVEEESPWRCTCGKMNPAEMLFCTACGSRKDRKPTPGGMPKETGEAVIPSGMKPPTDDDLLKKS